MKKVIGYDIDGCLLDSAPFFTMALMMKYDTEDIRGRDRNGYEKFYFKLKDVPAREVSELINFTIVKYHHVMREVQGALNAVRIIYHSTGEEPIFLTARKDYAGLMDLCFHNWMRSNNMTMPYIYKRVRYHGDKVRAAAELGITHYVEDRYKNCHDLAPHLEQVYMMHKTYNNRLIMKHGIKRVYGWSEVIKDFLRGN